MLMQYIKLYVQVNVRECMVDYFIQHDMRTCLCFINFLSCLFLCARLVLCHLS